MQAALWPAALRGSVPAVHEVVRIVEARARLLGLYAAPGIDRRARRDWPSCQGHATVVVRQDDCRHNGCDRHGQF